LLLRACLLSGSDALTAWHQWKDVFETSDLDEGPRRLLPLLYRNLQQQGISDPLIDTFKQEYFHAWSQNQLAFHRIAPLLRSFDDAGIQSMLLKGAALAVLFYEDVGLRPMKDIDLLVRHDQAKQSIQLLTSLGWKSAYSSPEALVPFEQATEFKNAEGQNLDLHWRLMWEGRQDLDDTEFWTGSISTGINGIQIRTLNPADQLLHVCVHGAKWNDTSSLRWVADAMMIIGSHRFSIDWARLVHQAQKRQLTLPMRETLAYLESFLAAPIPTETLSKLQNTPTSKLERWFYQIRLGPDDTLKTLPVVSHWINSFWFDCEGHLPDRLFQSLRYLQNLWKISRLWQVPFFLVAKPLKRIYSGLGRN
jgi:hypothetical protein